MRDYTELSKSVHCCVGCEESQCEICPRGDTPFDYIECKRKLADDAADAIEELLAGLERYRHAAFVISETCVDESKCHISPEDAIKKIREHIYYDSTESCSEPPKEDAE